jgi:hypothetical protein
VLISYFKNNVVLLNNLIKLFNKIITKVDKLCLLISLLLSIPKADIVVEVEKINMKEFCGTVRKFLDTEKLKILLLIKNNLLKFLTINIIYKWVWSLISLWSTL